MKTIIRTEKDRSDWLKKIVGKAIDKPIRAEWTVIAKRSIPQSNLFHMWVKSVSDYTGDTLEDTKIFFKEKYGVKEEKESIFNGKIITLKSTKYYTTKEMHDLMKGVEKDAWEYCKIVLPHPDDRFFLELEQHYG